MLGKVIAEIAFQIQSDLHYVLKTRLPFPWDFCRLDLNPDTRLMLNSGTYFIVYAAFLFSLIKHSVKELKNIGGNRLSTKNWCLAVLFSLVTATQVLWPAFLVSTYFITCSFYPWASALVVLLMNVPLAPGCLFQLTFSRSAELFEAYAQSFAISLDSVKAEETEPKASYANDQRVHSDVSFSEQLLPLASSSEDFESANESRYFSSSSAEEMPLTSTPISFKTQSTDSSQYVTVTAEVSSSSAEALPVHPTSVQPKTGESTTTDISEYTTVLSQTSEKYAEEMKAKHSWFPPITENADKLLGEKRNDKIPKGRPKVRSPYRLSKVPANDSWNKMGYCGRCWRGNNLPFLPGFSKLREPFSTRSGGIYGPNRRFLNTSEYVTQYGL